MSAEALGTVTVVVTEEERSEVYQLLATALGETRVEVHHTHSSPDYREQVERREELLRKLLAKFQHPGG